MHCQVESVRCPPARSHPAPARLGLVELPDRSAIVLDLGIDLNDSLPPALDGATKVRELTVDQCRTWAAQHAPVGRLLDTEGRREHGDACQFSPLSGALAAQAEFERSQAAGDALIGFYRLALVYLQNGLALQSLEEIDRLGRVMDRLEQAGLSTNKRSQLDLHRAELAAQQVQLVYYQRIFSAQLREQLNLASDQLEPLWPVFRLTPELISDGLAAEVETAWRHRGDLIALEQLRCLSLEDFLTLASGLMGRSNPLLGISRVARLSRWQLILSRNRALLENEYALRQVQLEELIDAKRRAIAVEVEEVWYSLEMRASLIEVKQSALAALDSDWNSRLRTKDIRPIEFSDEVQYMQARMELLADLVRERIEIEMDLVRLKKAQGVGARN